MIQIKTFPLKDSEAASEWLAKNYGLVVMGEKGIEIKVHGMNDPYIAIYYDKHGVGSPEYNKEYFTIELRNLKDMLIQYRKQFMEHKKQINLFPQYAPSREKVHGKHVPQKTAGYAAHEEGIKMTVNQIKLQKTKISVVEDILKDMDLVTTDKNDDSKEIQESEA